jgi:hypothetical protein
MRSFTRASLTFAHASDHIGPAAHRSDDWSFAGANAAVSASEDIRAAQGASAGEQCFIASSAWAERIRLKRKSSQIAVSAFNASSWNIALRGAVVLPSMPGKSRAS